ncbi:MAG: hypothetical protein D6786_06920 [Gammaproteobacteria bacterium]|nr:MAG: hypothetical protein D6786_06920 [Gammaproteobacteria bacterium]
MYTLGVGGLIAAYILIAVLLLSVLLYTRLHWATKAALIVITSAFYVVVYYSIPPLLGWPTRAELPDRFRVNATYIREPNKQLGTDGAIYLWITDLRVPPDEALPRAYELPYQDALHKKLVEVGKKLRKGMPQIGEKKKDEDASLVTNLQDRKGTAMESIKIDFYDMPDPLFPEK